MYSFHCAHFNIQVCNIIYFKPSCCAVKNENRKWQITIIPCYNQLYCEYFEIIGDTCGINDFQLVTRYEPACELLEPIATCSCFYLHFSGSDYSALRRGCAAGGNQPVNKPEYERYSMPPQLSLSIDWNKWHETRLYVRCVAGTTTIKRNARCLLSLSLILSYSLELLLSRVTTKWTGRGNFAFRLFSRVALILTSLGTSFVPFIVMALFTMLLSRAPSPWRQPRHFVIRRLPNEQLRREIFPTLNFSSRVSPIRIVSTLQVHTSPDTCLFRSKRFIIQSCYMYFTLFYNTITIFYILITIFYYIVYILYYISI